MTGAVNELTAIVTTKWTSCTFKSKCHWYPERQPGSLNQLLPSVRENDDGQKTPGGFTLWTRPRAWQSKLHQKGLQTWLVGHSCQGHISRAPQTPFRTPTVLGSSLKTPT